MGAFLAMNDSIRIHRNKIYHVFSRTLSEVQKNKTRSHKTHSECHQASSKSLTSTSSQILSKEFSKKFRNFTFTNRHGSEIFLLKNIRYKKFRKDPHPTPNFSITETDRPPLCQLPSKARVDCPLHTLRNPPREKALLEGSAP